jgi:hypothetical protein
MVWTLTDAGEMVSTRVAATTFAVAELEYSDAVLTMIPPDSPRLETPQATLSNPSSSNVSREYSMFTRLSPNLNSH